MVTTTAPRLVQQWRVVTDELGERHLVACWVAAGAHDEALHLAPAA